MAAVWVSAGSLVAQAPPPQTPAPVAVVSPKDRKEARKAFDRGVKLKKDGKNRAALEQFETASRLEPANADYATAREITKQAAVFEAIQRGNAAMLRKATIEAQADYREALRLDPDNAFAQERLRSFLAPPRNTATRYEDDQSPIELTPKPGVNKFEYRGDSRALLTQVAKAYGITAMFDDAVPSRRVRFDLGEADFQTAIGAAGLLTKTFWVPLSPTQIIFFQDTPANRRDYQKMSLRTFFFREGTDPKELNDLVNIFRVIFDARFVVVQTSNSSITVRAPQPLLAGMTKFFADLDGRKPQVALSIKVYQVSRNYNRQFGADLPLQFTTFNIGAVLRQFGVSNIDELIDQLIRSGALNGANEQGLQALLAQFLQSQNSQLASLLSNPFATYGGGLTLMGLAIPTTTQFRMMVRNTEMRLLDDLTLRASQGNAATLMIGTRYPIQNATYTSALGSSLLDQVLGRGLRQAAYPSFTYEDLGINFKATPVIHGDDDVRLDLDLKIRALAGDIVNGIPVIGNREYKSTLTLKNGESGVIVGMLERSESRSVSGMPVLGSIPGLAPVFSSENKEQVESEILIVITPHVLSVRDPGQGVIPL